MALGAEALQLAVKQFPVASVRNNVIGDRCDGYAALCCTVTAQRMRAQLLEAALLPSVAVSPLRAGLVVGAP